MRRAGLLLVLAPLTLACGPTTTAPQVTYWHDVKPITAAHCEGCHSKGGIGPVDLSTFAGAHAAASLMSADVQSHRMPPWMPADQPLAFDHERKLTSAQIATIKAWADAGAPEGDPKAMPKLPPPDQVTLEDDAEVKVPAPYTPDLSVGTDDYRCFVLDPGLTHDTAITGFDIHPGDGRVVHHVILFGVDPSPPGTPADQDAFTQLQKLEDEDPQEGYTCFGDARLDRDDGGEYVIGGWAPGSSATMLPPGTGVVMKKGAKIVMQVHYNLLTVQHTTDQTTAILQYGDPRNVSAAYMIPFWNTTFSVPPGVVKTVHTEHKLSDIYNFFGIPTAVQLQIWGVFPHMHLHGTDIKVTKVDTAGKVESLVDIPHWDFHWQQLYFYDDPIEPQLSDTLTLDCTYDNRASAQPYINGVQEQSQTLRWGDGTLDEMCLNFFYITVR